MRYDSYGLSEFLSQFIENSIRDKYWNNNIGVGDVVIDIGVDFGQYSLPALTMGASHVYAVEPRQSAINKFINNLILNGISEERTTVIKKAVSDISDDNIIIHYGGSKEEVTTITLDDLVSTYDIYEIDWIKIDVEGMEYKALKGAVNTLEAFRPKLIVENHSKEMEEMIIELLDSLDYKLVYHDNEFFTNIFGYNSHTVFYPLEYIQEV